MKLRRAGAI